MGVMRPAYATVPALSTHMHTCKTACSAFVYLAAVEQKQKLDLKRVKVAKDIRSLKGKICDNNVSETHPSIQEQPVLRILNDPLQSLLQVLACHRRARQDVPFMRLDAVESQSLRWLARPTLGVAGRDETRRDAPLQRRDREEAHFADFVLGQAVRNVVLVLEDEEGGAHEALNLLEMKGWREWWRGYFLQ